MAADGSALSPVAQQLGSVFAMDADSDGNVYVASQDSQSADVQSGVCLVSGFPAYAEKPGDVILTKWRPGLLTTVYSKRLAGRCNSTPRSIRADAGGTVTMGVTVRIRR